MRTRTPTGRGPARSVSTARPDGPESSAGGLLETAHALATDAVCGEVAAALRAAGLDSIVLKGPTTAEWLYPNEVRGYADADLLISPATANRAAAVLEGLGFAPFAGYVSPHGHPWLRSADGAEVDLHITLWGPHRPMDRLWAELQNWVENRQIGGTQVRVLNLPGRALHIVLHAAQHRYNKTKPREDLRRALKRTPFDAWRDAERLADRLWALGEMADGLLLEPDGRQLLRRLPLARAAAEVNHEDVPLAIGFERIAQAPNSRAKVAVVARSLFPPREELGIDGGGTRVALEYARRSLGLLARTPATIAGMRRLRRRQPPLV